MVELGSAFNELPSGEYYADLLNIAALSYEPRLLRTSTTNMKIETLSIATRNLRGFAKASRRRWINGWRKRRGHPVPNIILVQDTNLRSDQEICEICEICTQWQRVWQLDKTEQPLSYWSHTAAQSAGMGIPVSPALSNRAKSWNQHN